MTKKAHTATVVAYAATQVAAAVLFISSDALLHRNHYALLTAGGCAWVLLSLIIGTVLWLTKCPHCGNRFHHTRWIQNMFSFRCKHCGSEF